MSAGTGEIKFVSLRRLARLATRMGVMVVGSTPDIFSGKTGSVTTLRLCDRRGTCSRGDTDCEWYGWRYGARYKSTRGVVFRDEENERRGHGESRVRLVCVAVARNACFQPSRRVCGSAPTAERCRETSILEGQESVSLVWEISQGGGTWQWEIRTVEPGVLFVHVFHAIVEPRS